MRDAIRTRWAAIGAAVAVTIGGGGIGIVSATSPSNATAFVPITPCRLVDTRQAPDTVGPRAAPLGPGETLTVSAHGSNGRCTLASAIPTTATGLQLNVTALDATTPTFVTVWAAETEQPTASNLNPRPGQGPVPNAVTTGLSPTGSFNVFNGLGSVNLIVDVVGYYTDHHHDDRYYTKAEIDTRTYTRAEVDAAVAGVLDPIAAGFVNLDGTLNRSAGLAVTSVWNGTPGNLRYELTLAGEAFLFDRYATVVTPTCERTTVRVLSSNPKMLVFLNSSTGALVQCGFSFVVYKL